jgi:hypothetical protein
VVGGLGQGGFGGLNVQFNQLFHAFEGFLGQAKQGFDVCFLCGNNLVSVQHGDTPNKKVKNELRAAGQRVGCEAFSFLLRCNMTRSIGKSPKSASVFCCAATNFL